MSKLSYRASGVDVDKANKFVNRLKPLVKSTKRKGWVSNIGGFAGFFKPDISKYKNPIIVAATDGVGTKLMIAKWTGVYDTIGIDLVAMCANDIIACGAEPLFFLDYMAIGKLSPKISYDILKGVAKGCKISNSSLIGGETAELPGMYKKGDYDLAGFSVGIIDKNKIIDGSKIKKGELILGIASSGLHSNGYSLARKVFSKKELSGKIGKKILKPTTIYVKPVLDIVKKFDVKGIAHITGGGFNDNLVRLLPDKVSAIIYEGTWQIPDIFKSIMKKGVKPDEMYKTFNMGIGMAIVLPRKQILNAKKYLLQKHKLKSWVIGEIIKGKKRVEII